MSGIWGNNIQLSIFGESHGKAIGITISGLPSGFEIDLNKVNQEMERRAPGRDLISTARTEADLPEIISGYFNHKTTGTPLCAIIKNDDARSEDYTQLKDLMRPGHADYPGAIKYKGFNDYRGGGHFSGRLTAPLVFAGAICKQILEAEGISIAAHIKSINGIEAVTATEMEKVILEARNTGDSVGGTIECVIMGVKAGVGNPFFDSVESTLAHLAFSIPAVKGIEFGSGFAITEMFGSQANDELYYDGDQIKTKTNHNGGIIGGITNGMPIIFRCAIKPPSSISKAQNTINLAEKKNDTLTITGRHDPCIVQRVLPIIEAVAAIGILDLLKGREKELNI